MSSEGVRQRFDVKPSWVGLALLVGVLAVYLLTIAPGVVGGDPGELQFVSHILSMPHPTGTPLYVLLGKIWSELAIGPSVAWRLNVLAAISASLAVFVVFHCVYFLVQRIVPAAAAALLLAFGMTFWEQATMGDKYAFNAFMVALVSFLALRWGKSRSPTTLYLLALAYGLSLAHHRTMVLFFPPLLGYVWWFERRALWQDRRRLLRMAVLLLAPLLLYLYLPWAEARNLPPGSWHPQTARQWYDDMYDAEWIQEVRVVPIEQDVTLLFYLRTLEQDFTWAGLLLGLGGLAWQFRRRRADALFLVAIFLLEGVLAANYHVPRHWVFFLPSFVIFTLWLGQGLGAVWLGVEGVSRRLSRGRSVPLVALGILMMALPFIRFPGRYTPLRESHLGAGVLDVWRQVLKDGYMGDRLGRAIAEVEPNAVIVCDWEQSTPLWYYQQVEGWRPDVEVIYPFERLDEAMASGRPVYVARNHPGLADQGHPFSVGPLIALPPQPIFELPADAAPLGVRLGDQLELAGFEIGEASFRPGTVVPLSLYWRALRAPAHDYAVSLRLFDEAGQEVFKVDSQHPVLGTYPTSRWTDGEVVGDYYEIQLPSDLAPGTYHWGVILYRQAGEGKWENLTVAETGQELAMGSQFEVRERP